MREIIYYKERINIIYRKNYKILECVFNKYIPYSEEIERDMWLRLQHDIADNHIKTYLDIQRNAEQYIKNLAYFSITDICHKLYKLREELE